MKREMRRGKIPEVESTSIILSNPKYPHNVGAAVRAASCFGSPQVWFTGTRVPVEGHEGYRLPREERMKGYKDVDLINYDYPFDKVDRPLTPVAIELRPGSENLADFEHPENPIYVFGPEDGSIPKSFLQHCHRFVVIPTHHCVNLAAAVYIVLYDRRLKLHQKGIETCHDMAQVLRENRGFIGDC